MKKTSKILTNEVKFIDKEKRQAEYIISTNDKDRHGEIVEQSWNLENYNKNPIVLFGHNSYEADNVIGKCLDIYTEDDGERKITKAKVQFADEGTSKVVDTVWKLIEQDILRTVSVGFIPHEIKNIGKKDEPIILANNELLEFSIVPIPANPNAVALAFEDGKLDFKDVKFMLKKYKDETKSIQKLFEDINKSIGGEKDMSEEQATQVIDILTKIEGNTSKIVEKLEGNPQEPQEPKEPAEESDEEKAKAIINRIKFANEFI